MANKSQGSHWFERLLQLAFYLPSRDDGPTNQALYTDVNGDLQLGFVEIDLSQIVDPSVAGGSIIIGDGAGGLETSNNIILGSPTSNCVFETINDIGQDWCNWQIGTGGSAFTISKKSLGTIAAPLPLTSGTKVGGYAWIAEDGEALPAGPAGSPGYVGAELSAFVTEDQNGTNGGIEVRLSTTPNGSKTQQTVLIAREDGCIGLPTYTEDEFLQVGPGGKVTSTDLPLVNAADIILNKVTTSRYSSDHNMTTELAPRDVAVPHFFNIANSDIDFLFETDEAISITVNGFQQAQVQGNVTIPAGAVGYIYRAFAAQSQDYTIVYTTRSLPKFLETLQNPVGNNGTDYLTALTLTANIPVAGQWLLDLRMITSLNDANNDMEIRLLQDGVTTITEFVVEHKDPGGTGLAGIINLAGGTFNSGTSQRIPYIDSIVIDFASAGTHNIELQVAGSIAGIEPTIYEAQMRLEKY